MNSTEFASSATSTIEALSSAAHGAIRACRSGGERLGEMADVRWEKSFAQAGAKLKPETRRNAANAHKVFSALYHQGLQLSAKGAETAVDVVAHAAGAAVQRAAAFAASRKTA